MPAKAAPDLEVERRLRRQGFSRPAGLDEVGRGCLAGPVAAGAAVLAERPSAEMRAAVRDSKTLSADGLRAAYATIAREAAATAVGYASAAEIDRAGIGAAVRMAMRRAMAKLRPTPDHLIIDAVRLPAVNLPQVSFPRADSKSLSVAAASIVAKVERDALMARLADSFPRYGFESHKGYGTRRHVEAIRRAGPSVEHRMSFRPMSEMGRSPPRPSSSESGARAERFAAEALAERGMKVIGRNFRTRYGEVDIVAADGDTLAFVEVRARRARTGFGAPAETITAAKAARLIAAGAEYVQRAGAEWADWRIDFAAVELDGWGRPAAVEFIQSAVEDAG